jgi:aminomethyltransferase
MTIEENPYEVGYGYKWMVELEQEQEFIGREALREIAARGVARKLVGVELAGSRLGAYSDGSMPDFFPVTKDGEPIGRVTPGCWSPRLEKNIGYAMVPVEHSELGTRLVVERPEERSTRSSPTACSSGPSTPSSS